MAHDFSFLIDVIPAKAGIQEISNTRQAPIQPPDHAKINSRFSGIIGASLSAFICLVLLFPFTKADAGQIPADLIQRNARIQDADLIVSANTLIQRVNRGEKMLLIDIRNTLDYEALHIPGAMNIPLHFVKTKAYLKFSPIVLVDQGLSLHRLSPTCRELRKRGFDARILDGGMNAWSSHDGAMVGKPVRQMDYGRISPADFFLEKDDALRIVCDVSVTRSPASQHLMPYAVHLPVSGNSDQTVSLHKKFKSAHARNGAATLLVVNENGVGYRNLAGALDRAGFKNVFYLDGGVNAYGQYLEGLSRSWRPREKRVVTNSPCGNCGEKERKIIQENLTCHLSSYARIFNKKEPM